MPRLHPITFAAMLVTAGPLAAQAPQRAERTPSEEAHGAVAGAALAGGAAGVATGFGRLTLLVSRLGS